MIERTCDNCGKRFLKRNSALKTTKHDFCCRKCNQEFKATHSTNVFIEKDNYCEIIINSHTFGQKFVKIDIEDKDKCSQYSWVLSQHEKTFYIVARNKAEQSGKNIYLHNFLLNKPSSFTIDHINRNPFDNRKSNLRICKQYENNYNKSIKLGKSKEKYISFDRRRNKYRVNFNRNGKQIFIGYFDTIEQAKSVRDKKLQDFVYKDFVNIQTR